MRCVVSCSSTSFPWLVFFFGALLWGSMIHKHVYRKMDVTRECIGYILELILSFPTGFNLVIHWCGYQLYLHFFVSLIGQGVLIFLVVLGAVWVIGCAFLSVSSGDFGLFPPLPPIKKKKKFGWDGGFSEILGINTVQHLIYKHRAVQWINLMWCEFCDS